MGSSVAPTYIVFCLPSTRYLKYQYGPRCLPVLGLVRYAQRQPLDLLGSGPWLSRSLIRPSCLWTVNSPSTLREVCRPCFTASFFVGCTDEALWLPSFFTCHPSSCVETRTWGVFFFPATNSLPFYKWVIRQRNDTADTIQAKGAACYLWSCKLRKSINFLKTDVIM